MHKNQDKYSNNEFDLEELRNEAQFFQIEFII